MGLEKKSKTMAKSNLAEAELSKTPENNYQVHKANFANSPYVKELCEIIEQQGRIIEEINAENKVLGLKKLQMSTFLAASIITILCTTGFSIAIIIYLLEKIGAG